MDTQDVVPDGYEPENEILTDFLNVRGSGFKDTLKFEQALIKHGLTPDKLMGQIRKLIYGEETADAIKCRAMEVLRKLAELVYGTEVTLKTDELHQESMEEIKKRKQEVIDQIKSHLDKHGADRCRLA